MTRLKLNNGPLAALLVLFVSLTGCSSTPVSDEAKQNDYNAAMTLVRQGQYDQAIAQFEKLKAKAEEPVHKGQADMGHLYTLYKKEDYAQVITMGSKMIETYPKHPQLSYVIFLRAKSYQALGEESLNRLLDTMKPSGEYPEDLRNAYREYSRLVKNFPTSEYNKEVHKHLAKIRDQLARFELHGAQYHLVQGNYTEVLRRTRYVNEYYPNSPARKQALSLMEKAYIGLDRKEKARDIAKEIENMEHGRF